MPCRGQARQTPLADPSGAITVLAPNNGLRGNPMALGEDARQQNCSLILKRLLVSASDSRTAHRFTRKCLYKGCQRASNSTLHRQV
jgi:hypothetical protein